jgi:hypothetical protein
MPPPSPVGRCDCVFYTEFRVLGLVPAIYGNLCGIAPVPAWAVVRLEAGKVLDLQTHPGCSRQHLHAKMSFRRFVPS